MLCPIMLPEECIMAHFPHYTLFFGSRQSSWLLSDTGNSNSRQSYRYKKKKSFLVENLQNNRTPKQYFAVVKKLGSGKLLPCSPPSPFKINSIFHIGLETGLAATFFRGTLFTCYNKQTMFRVSEFQQ